MMAGIPIIMSYQNYYTTLYHQFIPKELIIFYDNHDANKTSSEQIEPVLKQVMNMSELEYKKLSFKLYVQGTYFRKYYNCELEHLYYFMNNLQYNS